MNPQFHISPNTIIKISKKRKQKHLSGVARYQSEVEQVRFSEHINDQVYKYCETKKNICKGSKILGVSPK